MPNDIMRAYTKAEGRALLLVGGPVEADTAVVRSFRAAGIDPATIVRADANAAERPRGRALMVVGDWCATDRAIYDALCSARTWENLLVIVDPAPTLRRFFLAVAEAAGVSIPARMPLIDIPSHVNSSLLRLDVTAIWWMGGCVKRGSCGSAYELVQDLFELFMKDHGMSLIVESSAWPDNPDVARLFKIVEAGRLHASDIRSILGGTR